MTSPDPFAVDLQACRHRQERLLREMQQHDLERVVLTRHESVQWLTGAYVGSPFALGCVLEDTARVTLVLPSRKQSLSVAADEIVCYEEKKHSTMIDRH